MVKWLFPNWMFAPNVEGWFKGFIMDDKLEKEKTLLTQFDLLMPESFGLKHKQTPKTEMDNSVSSVVVPQNKTKNPPQNNSAGLMKTVVIRSRLHWGIVSSSRDTFAAQINRLCQHLIKGCTTVVLEIEAVFACHLWLLTGVISCGWAHQYLTPQEQKHFYSDALKGENSSHWIVIWITQNRTDFSPFISLLNRDFHGLSTILI